VAVGLTVVEPLAAVEVKPPGEMEIEVALVVDQRSVELAPESMVVGLAAKEEIVGGVPVVCDGEPMPAQPARAKEATRDSTSTQNGAA
jgi:hypothetical protein